MADGVNVQAGDVVDIVDGKVTTSIQKVNPYRNITDTRTQDNKIIEFKKLSDEYSILLGSSNNKCAIINNHNGNQRVVETYDSGASIYNQSIAILSDYSFVIYYEDPSGDPYFTYGEYDSASNTLTFGNPDEFQFSTTDQTVIVGISETMFAIISGSGRNSINCSVYSYSKSDDRFASISSYTSYISLTSGNVDDVSAAIISYTEDEVVLAISYAQYNVGVSSLILTIDKANQLSTFSNPTLLYSDRSGGSSNRYMHSAYDSGTLSINFKSSTLSGDVIIVANIDNTTISKSKQEVVQAEYNNYTSNHIRIGNYILIMLVDGTTTNVKMFDVSTLNLIDSFELDVNLGIAILNRVNDSVFNIAHCQTNGYIDVYNMKIVENMVAGDFEYASKDAIAITSGTNGNNVDVVFSGTIKTDFSSGDSIITSRGVCAYGIIDNVLSVYAKNRPLRVISGRYIGNGKYGETDPTVIQFDTTPFIIFIQNNAEGSYRGITGIIIPLAMSGLMVNSSGAIEPLDIIEHGPNISWYSSDSAISQLNVDDTLYYYVAFL